MSFPFSELREVIEDILEVPVIFGDQNGDRPAKVYASIRHENVSSRVHLEEMDVDENNVQYYREPLSYEIQVQIYGPGAYSRAAELSSRLRLPRVVDRLTLLGVSLLGPVTCRNVPSLLDNSQYEERGIIEMNVGYMSVISDEVGVIEEVSLDCQSSITFN